MRTSIALCVQTGGRKAGFPLTPMEPSLSSTKQAPFFHCTIARLAAAHTFLMAEISRHALTDLSRFRKTTRPTSCKESFVCNCWVCSTLLPWWQTERAFGMAHLSELTHCLARIYIPFFEQCKQIRATLARRFLCGTGVAPARQETGVFPDR